MAEKVPAEVIRKLREAVARFSRSEGYEANAESRDNVLERYQPVFAAEHVPEITEDDFHSFLLAGHWTGLQRSGSRICANMRHLRKALRILVDETEPVSSRLDQVISLVSGMGKNIATAILLVMQPDRYGVWNNRSESRMKLVGIWPAFDRGESFGSRYNKVNQILLQLRDALQIDLWTLDTLWWYLDQEEQKPAESTGDVQRALTLADTERQGFGLERHLHEFLRDNWGRLGIGHEWALHQEPGDDEAGYEYPSDVGRIDLLAKHRSKPRWLVVELKRNQTSDQTVGQLLRYIGWVKKNLAKEGEEVQGLIICHEADDAIRYALSAVPNVELLLYEVEFHLRPPDRSSEASRSRGGK